jgi:hypothetical protein
VPGGRQPPQKIVTASDMIVPQKKYQNLAQMVNVVYQSKKKGAGDQVIKASNQMARAESNSFEMEDFANNIDEDDPTFRQNHQNNHQGFLDDIGDGMSSIEDFFDGMAAAGDDLNKIKKDFAGDTFSQISSTFEPQPLNNV